MNKAQQWAESYFQRLNAIVEDLKNHPLVNHLVYVSFPGLNDADLSKIEGKLIEEVISNKNSDEANPLPAYRFDDYMKAFYKISNGLHIAWDSHIIESALTENKILTNAPLGAFVVANDDLHLAEGFLSLLPMQHLVSYLGLKIYGDPQYTQLGKELNEQGHHFTYFDFYNYYYDTCIAIHPNDPCQNLLYPGNDHSAEYESAAVSDFVIYMEQLLANYFSVTLRYKAFHPIATVNEFRSDDYEGIAQKTDLHNPYKTIDDLLKYHALEEELLEKYGDLNYLKSKPEAIYNKIESLLEVVLEDEMEE